MNQGELQTLAQIRADEAQALFDREYYDGAYYLAGYAIECALKACFAKKVNQYDFPDKKLATDAYTHDLEQLVLVAGLKEQLRGDMQTDSELQRNWMIVTRWRETARYESGKHKEEAEQILNAIDNAQSGVMKWVRKFL